MYADNVTASMERALEETDRRRAVQEAYNVEHGIEPQTIRKAVTDILAQLRGDDGSAPVPGKGERKRRPGEKAAIRDDFANLAPDDLGRLIQTLTDEMNEASADLRFEYAARLRDEIKELKRELRDAGLVG
jgi:excinuclease ABC subunit B